MTFVINKIQDFMRLEASAGIFLILAAAFALFATNSPLSAYYDMLLTTPVAVQIGALAIDKPLLLWINDGLMAIFFFLVGLEVKREVLKGELSRPEKVALPVIAAIGGMMIPALIYTYFNWQSPESISGWAIPAATDIAFALGILALLGSRVPVALKIFLLTVAIIDDLGAILIIALFYTDDLSVLSLAIATIGFASLIGLNKAGVKRISPYVLIGTVIWVCVLKSGVHATLAGVFVALTIPIQGATAATQSPLEKLEHDLHPWVAYLILPVFAFANAGVSFSGISIADVANPVPLGIAAGLIIGKQLGVFGFAWIAIKMGLAKLPKGMSFAHLYGVACLTGIGFTMSLFIGTLAFDDAALLNEVRLGVLVGSLFSGALGYIVLRILTQPARAEYPLPKTAKPHTPT